MPELRTDWLMVAASSSRKTGRFDRTNFAPTRRSGRINRPSPMTSRLPILSGNESCTPHAVYEKRDGHGNWQLRVVPNAFPAVDNLSGAVCERKSLIPGVPALDLNANPRLQVPIPGVHEVIIESPLHKERMADISPTHCMQIIEAYTTRLRYWRERPLRYGLLFKNQGPRAGAFAHAYPQPTDRIALCAGGRRSGSSRRRLNYFAQGGQCAFCQLIGQERA